MLINLNNLKDIESDIEDIKTLETLGKEIESDIEDIEECFKICQIIVIINIIVTGICFIVFYKAADYSFKEIKNEEGGFKNVLMGSNNGWTICSIILIIVMQIAQIIINSIILYKSKKTKLESVTKIWIGLVIAWSLLIAGTSFLLTGSILKSESIVLACNLIFIILMLGIYVWIIQNQLDRFPDMIIDLKKQIEKIEKQNQST